MKVKFKGTIFFSLIVSFFLFMPKVEAETMSFYAKPGGRYGKFCYNNKLGIKSCGSGYDAPMKTSKNGDRAFCGNRKKTLCSGSSCKHRLDTSWNSANTCTYYTYSGDEKTRHNDGECSIIVGNILKQYKQGGGSEKDWRKIQSAVWTYLGHSGWGPDSYFYGDSKATRAWNENSSVQKILKQAFKDYVSYRNAVGNAPLGSDAEAKVDISYENGVKDLNFYFVSNGSNGSTCGGTNGVYKTKMITVTNNDSNTENGKKINVSIDSDNSAIQVCRVKDSGTSECSDDGLNVGLSYKGSVKFYLKTNKVFSKGVSEVPLQISASYVEKITTNIDKIYDSKRYVMKKDKWQPMLVLYTYEGNGEGKVKRETIEILNFRQTSLGHNEVCKNLQNAGKLYIDNENKVCANKSRNQNDYIAKYSDCSCMSLDLGSGRNVNVVVTQHAVFKFGNLTPNSVYAGGGFELYSADKSAGTLTEYSNAIKWYYYDSLNGKPYYYNSVDPTSTDASGLETEITDKLQKNLNQTLNLDFYAVDSNKFNDNNDKEVKKRMTKKLKIENNVVSDSSDHTINVKFDRINLPESYFSVNGSVSYTSTGEGEYSIKGGNKYYVPLKYNSSDNKFKFNIASTSQRINLSLIKGRSFWYNADCDVDITSTSTPSNPSCSTNDPSCNDTPILGVTYRTMSIKTPFPKTVPLNWKDWYANNSNKARLSDSFSSNKLIYKIELNSNNLSQVNTNSSSYSNWGSIRKNGSSSFVTNNDFSKRANNNSYCAIGEFSSTCDR